MVPRVKQQFWPSVPDPANSSLGKWVPAELPQVRPGRLLPPAPGAQGCTRTGNRGHWEHQCDAGQEGLHCTGCDHTLFLQEPLQVTGVREPSLATISTVTVLERAAGKQPPSRDKEPTAEPTGTFPAPPQPYVRQERPGTAGAAVEPQRRRGGSGEPVQYARVVGAGYKGQQHVPPRLYLRCGSSSSQPLLADPSPSPQPYENLWFHGAAPQGCPGDGGCPEELPASFPLLQGLRIGGAEELHDCRVF